MIKRIISDALCNPAAGTADQQLVLDITGRVRSETKQETRKAERCYVIRNEGRRREHVVISKTRK